MPEGLAYIATTPGAALVRSETASLKLFTDNSEYLSALTDGGCFAKSLACPGVGICGTPLRIPGLFDK